MVSARQINRDILKIAVPNILGNVTIALLGIVDTWLMGHEGENSELLIGAIGLAGIIFNLIYWNFGFLRVAATGITAQAFGEENQQKQALTFFRALFLGLLIACIIFLFRNTIGEFGFSLLEKKENIEAIGFAREYFQIRILAVPAVMMLFGFRGWFYGMQNAIYPFILTLVVNIVNIGCSIYFVRVLNWSVAGVAWGTVIAQYTCLLAAILLFTRYRWVTKFLNFSSIFIAEQLEGFFKVSGFVFGRNIMLSAVFTAFTFFSSTVDELYLAANQILIQFFYLMSFAVDGFAYASEALVGKYTGAKSWQGVKSTIKWTMIWGITFGFLYALVYTIFGDQLLYQFTPNEDIVNTGRPFIFWLSIISIIGAVAFIWDGVFIGATWVWEMFSSMTMATVSFFIVYFALRKNQPQHAIWAGMTAYMLIRAVAQWIIYVLKKHRHASI